MLDDADGARMLFDYLSPDTGTIDDARAVSAKLGGLPLAIRLAGLYLAETSNNPWPDPHSIVTLAEYGDSLSKGVIPDAEARDALSHVWGLSIDLLDRRGVRFARPLLHVLSLFADAKLPFRTLLDPSILARFSAFAGITGAELWKTVVALTDLGMADQIHSDAPSSKFLKVHPLVQSVTRISNLSAVDNLELFSIAVALLHHAIEHSGIGTPKQVENWQDWDDLAPHVRALVNRAVAHELPEEFLDYLADAACGVTKYMLSRGLHEESESLTRAALRMSETALGNGHETTLHVVHDLAVVLVRRCKYFEAEAAFRRAISGLRDAVGEESPVFWSTQHDYAHFLEERGELALAESLHREILQVRMGNLDEKDPHLLTFYHCLATTLRRVGKAGEAKEIYEKVLAARTKTLGPNHQSTMHTRHHYAHALSALGLKDDAEELHRQLIEDQVSLMGEDHPSTLNNRHCLSHLLLARGDLEEAVAQVRMALEGRKRVFGEQHPATLDLRQCLASMLAERQEFTAEARQELALVVQLFADTLGAEHSLTLRTRHELAHVLSASDEAIEAQKELARIYAIQLRVLGSKHQDTRETKMCLEAERRRSSRRPGTFPLHGGGKASKRKKKRKH
ncbi:tetratricopeptide repeat protein [Micromonospora chersina]|uniref:tetratricopeptide repeat protein n=1 Tax=Micromonospora chersina TaxID=47854 RepID=UPI0037194D86